MCTPDAKAGGLRNDVLWRKSKKWLRVGRQLVQSSAIPFVHGQQIFLRIEFGEAGRHPDLSLSAASRTRDFCITPRLSGPGRHGWLDTAIRWMFKYLFIFH
jgi:hypothetical protein